ncbi:CTD kinase subunit beta [Lecanosticta acicola]|uniref:CTD kinase subunit beta n=1 Tax=Lecanosticta acicola TaxID=111012 RepID=A0AAI8YXB0_9PEZI|nr:CTD kinase subunit beta [Lecanosticta acicola]
MVYVPWQELGICRFFAMHKTTCNKGEACRWRHPPEEEVRHLWDQYQWLESQQDPAQTGARSLHSPPSTHFWRAPPPPNHPVSSNDDHTLRRGTYLPPRPSFPASPPTIREEGHAASDFHVRGAYERKESAPDSRSSFPPQIPLASDFLTMDRADSVPRSHVSNQQPAVDPHGMSPDRAARPKRKNEEGHGYDLEASRKRRRDNDFDPSRSQNPFVNGSRLYRFVWGNPLCVQCGELGHLPRDKKCASPPLSKQEHDFLYDLVREEQNRNKAERGLDHRQPTSSLHPTLTPEPEMSWPDPAPAIPTGLETLSSDQAQNEWREREPLESQSGYWERSQTRRLPRSLLRDDDDPSARDYREAPYNGRKQDSRQRCAKRRIGDVGDVEEEKQPKKLKPEVEEADADAEAEADTEEARCNLGEIGPHEAQAHTSADVQAGRIAPPTPPSAPPAAPVPPSLLHSFAMGATKRLSNGEAKNVGPHPSTIRVSASYMTQSAIEKRLQPPALDAQERSLAEAREDSVRLQGVTWLDSVRRALQLPVKTYTTACVYYHKFRLAHPTVEYSYTDAAAASLLTSCKNEDTLKKSRDILAAAYNLKQPSAHEQVGADDPIFEAPSRVVIGLERLVLESGGFDFRSRSPHHTLVKISKSLPKSDDLRSVSQLAWTILTDIHRTFAVLKQTSSTLALASLELAAHFIATTSPNNACTVRDDLQALDLNTWHTTREEVMETLLDALDLYTHHTSSTILGTKYSLDDLLRIRLALNKECTESSLPRYTVIQPPPSPDNANGTSNTLRVANGHPTPVSPPQPGTQPPQQSNGTGLNLPTPEGGGTLRFMLNPQRATEERAEVNRYYTEEWEEYEEEIEVPIPRNRSRERDHARQRDYSLDSRPRHGPGRDDRFEDRRSTRDDRDGPPPPRGVPPLDRERDRERLREREREAERERTRLRDRDRERRYDDRRYDDRERDRRYDDRRERDRERRYYDDDRRRPRDERR